MLWGRRVGGREDWGEGGIGNSLESWRINPIHIYMYNGWHLNWRNLEHNSLQEEIFNLKSEM